MSSNLTQTHPHLRIARESRLSHIHVNSQPLGNYDQDLNVGVVSWQDTEALLYALKAIGYREHFGIDVNPEHMRFWRQSRSTREPSRS
jgi:xylose isomerase